MSIFTIMTINTTQLTPVGQLKLGVELSISDIKTLDSIKLHPLDVNILTEKLHHTETQVLTDGQDFYIVREDILVKISHPSLKSIDHV